MYWVNCVYGIYGFMKYFYSWVDLSSNPLSHYFLCLKWLINGYLKFSSWLLKRFICWKSPDNTVLSPFVGAAFFLLNLVCFVFHIIIWRWGTCFIFLSVFVYLFPYFPHSLIVSIAALCIISYLSICLSFLSSFFANAVTSPILWWVAECHNRCLGLAQTSVQQPMDGSQSPSPKYYLIDP